MASNHQYQCLCTNDHDTLFGNLVRRPPSSSHEFPLFNILQRGHFYGRQMALATVGFQHLSNLNHKKWTFKLNIMILILTNQVHKRTFIKSEQIRFKKPAGIHRINTIKAKNLLFFEPYLWTLFANIVQKLGSEHRFWTLFMNIICQYKSQIRFKKLANIHRIITFHN